MTFTGTTRPPADGDRLKSVEAERSPSSQLETGSECKQSLLTTGVDVVVREADSVSVDDGHLG